MARFRQKVLIVEATQWFQNGDHPLDYSNAVQGYEGGELRSFSAEHCKTNAWEGQVVRYFRHPTISGDTACPDCGKPMHVHGWIDNGISEGLRVCPGDWVITRSDGSHYPMNAKSFAERYAAMET